MVINNYKLIVFDLDGTLLTPEFELLPGTVEAVGKLRQLGLRVTVATGRSYKSAQPFLETLEIDEPMVFSNGSVFDNPDTGEREVICGIPLETALIVAMIQSGFNISLKMHFADGRILKSNATPWPDEGKHFEVGQIVENLAAELDDDPIKVVFFGDQEELDRFETKLADILGKKSQVRLFRSHTSYVEMTNKRVSKGDAVQLLIDKLGILPEEVIAVGDQENDFEMIRDLGLGVQAGNHKALSEVSDHQIAHPEKQGIEELYEWLLDRYGREVS
ncbi:MAG: hypothetical protein COB67_04850 [SAR324 cluster bacterium]|uniref:HAD family phosphatase n=1 Tax=SAR324 cluster bacterium TaxID=2024889 RepID=A0A2A4T6D7_9DELT|nr:MAG: hypothetical protein COB67_04850 [SAR324 cluster bacterium]